MKKINFKKITKNIKGRINELKVKKKKRILHLLKKQKTKGKKVDSGTGL